jgi:transcription-repair coupling factor (superfamily II helicase)
MFSFNIVAEQIAASKEIAPLLAAFKQEKFPLEIEGAQGSLRSIVLAAFFRRKAQAMLVVVPSEREAGELVSDLKILDAPAVLFPWWGTVPYRDMPPISPVWSARAGILSALAGGAPLVAVTSQRAFMSPVPPPSYTKQLSFTIKKGAKLDTASLAQSLGAWGYTRVQRLQYGGEYVIRGELIDVMTADGGEGGEAYRILLDFDTVESIKKIDTLNQNSHAALDSLRITALKEVVWDDDLIEALGAKLEQLPEFQGKSAPVIDALINKRTASGQELLFPLAFEKSASLSDYFSDNAIVFLEWERLCNAQESLNREYQSLYRSALRERPVPAPSRIVYDFNELTKSIPKKVSFLSLKNNEADSAANFASRFSLNCDPARSFFGNINYMKEEFAVLLEQKWTIVIAASSEIQVERIRGLLHDIENIIIAQIPLFSGFALPEIKLLFVQEKEIFGSRYRPPRSLATTRSAAIDTFVDLNPGDYVVHINYGIGLFKGIERISALGNERDYIKLEYADEETVFVPIEQVNLVQRYIGNEGAAPRLDSLGSKSWSERKERARRAAEELAASLISLYSKRKASRGFAFPADTEWQTMFEASFPFEETEDQLRCVEEIKFDMEQNIPMDRIVCGDVGYGKTEVALRACFKAVMGGKQVAFLSPTTILSEQHYENFIERFRNFPVKIAMLSRFVDKKSAKKTIEALKEGGVDILIGTHRIIQKDIQFKNLGLIIIDEEQRFGVKDKERLKELKHNVDCLSLSATPIPRTLHKSLLKIRDMSILATAPRNRRPIETFIDEYDEEKIARALRFEAERGGQVFFLHNRIESLEEVRTRLQHLVPEILLETAHGKMDAEELEDIMHRFIHGGFQVLVSTTIIENGIDIPNVNTIIIDRAEKYGVSQLYQLRGRVGRSDKSAYAYLFYPPNSALSETAMKRLQVISDFTELGSGFKIAMKDMEIRGAGNLLGREQSGNIFSVGYDLYVRLLDEAIRKLQSEAYEPETETLLELEYTGFIPNSYIDSAVEKMEVYKKIAAIKSKDEIEQLHAEIDDRFGPPPSEVLSLLSLAEMRIICREIAVSSLREHGGVVRVEFTRVAKVNVDRLLRMIKEGGGRIKLDPKAPNVVLLQTGKIGLKEKSEFIREKLAALV